MRFLCKAGKHWYNSEEKADACHSCRRHTDAAVRNYFRRQSVQMLLEAGVWPDVRPLEEMDGAIPIKRNRTKGAAQEMIAADGILRSKR